LYIVDLFHKVVPMVVRNAVTSFEQRKSEIVFHEIGRLREATQTLNTYVVYMLHILFGIVLTSQKSYLFILFLVSYFLYLISCILYYY
jgi:hypothetical protein